MENTGNVVLHFRKLSPTITESIKAELANLKDADYVQSSTDTDGNIIATINTDDPTYMALVCAKICSRRAFVTHENTIYPYADKSTATSLLKSIKEHVATPNGKLAVDKLISTLDQIYLQ